MLTSMHQTLTRDRRSGDFSWQYEAIKSPIMHQTLTRDSHSDNNQALFFWQPVLHRSIKRSHAIRMLVIPLSETGLQGIYLLKVLTRTSR